MRRSRLSPTSFLLPGLLVLAGALPARAGLLQEEEPAPTTTASERLGLRPGMHQLTLYGGFFRGDIVHDATLRVPPLSATRAELRVELDDASTLGVAYSYMAHERWAVEFSAGRVKSELANGTRFDQDYVVSILDQSTLGFEEKERLLARLRAHAEPRDMNVSFFDVSAIHVINPSGRWIGEVGAGIGWADVSLDDDPAIFENFMHTTCDDDPNCAPIVINEIDAPGDGTRCPLDDPCVELEGKSGLSWNLLGRLRYAFNDHVHLQLGSKLRLIQQATDPGDSFITGEATLGITFLVGGD